MGLKGRLTAEIEIKSSGHRVYDHYSTKPHNLSNVSPAHVHGFQLHEGDIGKPGSIYIWNYTVGGKACVVKALIESVDEVNKTVSPNAIEGDVLKDYKKFVWQIHTTEKEAKRIIEYEKLHEDGPHPADYLTLAPNVSESIDDLHLKV